MKRTEQKSNLLPMRTMFARWLIGLCSALTLGFLVGLAVFFSGVTRVETADRMRVKLEDAAALLAVKQDIMDLMGEAMDLHINQLLVGVTRILEQDPTIAGDPDRLLTLGRQFDLDALYIMDAHGVLAAGYPVAPGQDVKDITDLWADTGDWRQVPATQTYVLATDPTDSGVMSLYGAMTSAHGLGTVVLRIDDRFFGRIAQFRSLDMLLDEDDFSAFGDLLLLNEGIVVSATTESLIGLSAEELFGSGWHPQGLDQLITGTFKGKSAILYASAVDESTLVAVELSQNAFAQRNLTFFILFGLSVAFMVVVLFTVMLLVKRILLRGMEKIHQGLDAIAAGDLGQRIDVRTSLEFTKLSDGINDMLVAIQAGIDKKAARNHADMELAHHIQMSVLDPLTRYQDHPMFTVAAAMQPARDVGGDLYDFFPARDHHVWLEIADVSGKGIPAALFMMTVKTLIGRLAENSDDPVEVLVKANRILCENNQAGMFVTLWLGLLNLQTGEIIYANAGHNPPLVRHIDGTVEWIKCHPNRFLAAFPELVLTRNTLTLAQGDTLLLYTDGVTEAFNVHGDMYGNKRLETLLTTCAQARADHLVPSVVQDVKTFADGTEQSDDITLLAITFQGGNPS